MLKHWLDSKPAAFDDLREEELTCRPGDIEGAIRIVNRLRTFLDEHTRALDRSEGAYTRRGPERRWLYRQIAVWQRRIDNPSAWFRSYGTSPREAGVEFSREAKEDAALLRVDEVLLYYEGRSSRTPREIVLSTEAGREARRGRRRREYEARKRKRAEARVLVAEPEPEWMSPQEREHVARGIAQSITESVKSRANRG